MAFKNQGKAGRLSMDIGEAIARYLDAKKERDAYLATARKPGDFAEYFDDKVMGAAAEIGLALVAFNEGVLKAVPKDG